MPRDEKTGKLIPPAHLREAVASARAYGDAKMQMRLDGVPETIVNAMPMSHVINSIGKNSPDDEPGSEGYEKLGAIIRNSLTDAKRGIDNQLEKTNRRVDQLEGAINRGGALGLGQGTDAARVSASDVQIFNAVRNANLDSEGLREYREGLVQFWRVGEKQVKPDVLNTLRVGIDSDGGVWCPPAVSARIIEKIRETSPIRQYASVETIGEDSLEGLLDNSDVDSGWVSEEEVRPDTNTPQVGRWSVACNEQYASPKVTQKLLDDASINVESWLSMKIAKRLARVESTAFVAGTGVRQPRGLLTYPTAAVDDASRPWVTFEHVVSGASGGFAASNPVDKLIDVQLALKSEFAPDAVWLMRRSTAATIRKFKDGQGNYLWQPSTVAGQPPMLLGHPLVFVEDMPAVAAGTLPIAFGNLRETYQIVDHRSGVRVLRDPYTNKPYVKFYTTKRTGGGVVNFESLKFLKISA